MLDKGMAYRFIALMGFVSLLSDFTYEGARGIIGPYLAYLGASALLVGAVSGFAELMGYWVRLASGLISDRFKNYWAITLLGYALNLLSVPLLGFAKGWQTAGLLISLERLGKGMRTPSRDVLLSRATQAVGHGKGFGIHEFLDQVGALLGPLTVGFLLFLDYGYRKTFFFLFVPALLALWLLLLARRYYVDNLQVKEVSAQGEKLGRVFYLYLLSSSLVALSFLPFPLIGFHLTQHAFEGWKVSLLFAFAMGVDALSALFFGFLFDRIGFLALVLGLSLGLLAMPSLFFLKEPIPALLFWGISLGVQESIMRSTIAKLSPLGLRGRAYGFFHFFFGLFAFLGSTLMGYLYQVSVMALLLYTLGLQAIALILFLRLKP